MMKRSVLSVFILLIVFFTGMDYVYSQDQLFIQTKINDFIRKIYSENDELQIKFGNIPSILKGRPNVKNISFAKVPDAKGDGICLIEIIDVKTNKNRNLFVPFRSIRKAKVYVLKHDGKKGDVIRTESVTVRETQFNERKPGYPSTLNDIIGRTLKKDVAEGTVISYSLIDDPVIIHRGEIIDIIAENKKLFVQTKGKALERGRMGESIRVKNMSSDREIVGKVVSGDKILVSF